MKKVSLYSKSDRARKAGVDKLAAETEVAPAMPNPGSLRARMQRFGAPFIRVMSYPNDPKHPISGPEWRAEAITRMASAYHGDGRQ